jgi:DNA-binding transcriptional LysR family regulator
MEVDLGIAVNPTRHPDLMIRKLCDDTVTFWGCAKPSINQDLSSGRAVLICVPDLLQTQELLKKMNRTGLRFARVLESSDLQVVAALTASGAGVGILPGRVVAMMGEKKFQRLSKAPTAQDEICLLYRVENKHLRSLQVMSQMISAAFTQS